MWLVITSIHHSRPIDLQAITERKRRVIQITGREFDIVDGKSAFHKVMIPDLGSTLIQRNRKVVVLHLPGQNLTQRFPDPFGAVYVPFVPAHEKRKKEWDALDVVPMRVADKDVPAQGLSVVGDQLLS